MIPISFAPKRFVAALGRGRMGRVQQRAQRERAWWLSPTSALMGPRSLPLSTLSDKSLSNTMGLQRPSQQLASCSYSALASDDDDMVMTPPLTLKGDRDSRWWTGKAPSKCAGYGADGRLYSLPLITFDAGLTKEKIQRYFDNTWTLTEVLLGCLQGEEAFMVPPYHELRHPLIFYYGHPAALYVNKLRVAGLVKEPINPYYEVIFETGVDEMSWDDLSKNKMQWPSVEQVHEYRKEVYRTVSDLISRITEDDLAVAMRTGDMKDSPLWALFMGFEHERIHLETSSVLITELPARMTRFPKNFPAYHASIYKNNQLVDAVRIPREGTDYPTNHLIPVQKQSVTLGKPKTYPSFGWDNEYGQRAYEVPAFNASKFKTTNGEFFEFVADAGYAKPEYWTEAGWRWRAFRNAKWPAFWVRDGPQGLNHFALRLLFDEVAMKWDLPVIVNFHEATAFATWKSKRAGKHLRVMTELEHHAIRNAAHQMSNPSTIVDLVTEEDARGDRLLSYKGANLNLGCGSVSPVDALPPNEKGFHDVFGNCWDWTSDYFSPLEGFEVHSLYEDFSTPCFDGLHHVIMGGSFISTGDEASIFSRYHFRPHFFQHASFRLVEAEGPDSPMVCSDMDSPGPYVGTYPFRRSSQHRNKISAAEEAMEREARESAEMSKHFGAVSPSFGLVAAQRSAAAAVEQLVLTAAKGANVDVSRANVLEVGCGRGGVVFKLAEVARFVMGIDHHQGDIDAARVLAVDKKASYTLRGEGGRRDTLTVSLPHHISASEQDGGSIPMGSVEFRCADPMCLPAELSGFDVCVLNDVLDKVSSPGSVLSRMGGVRGMVRGGGVLVVLSTFDWKVNCTPKSLWLGDDKESPLEALKKRLSPDFELLSTQDVPVFWQKASRELQGRLYHATMWQRK